MFKSGAKAVYHWHKEPVIEILSRQKLTEHARSLAGSVCFTVWAAQSFIRLLRSSTGAVRGLSASLRGTLKLVGEGGESVTHSLAPHILYFHWQSGDLNWQPSDRKPAFQNSKTPVYTYRSWLAVNTHCGICVFFAKTLQDQTRNKNNVYWRAGAPPQALLWPSNHLKLQVRIRNRPERMSPTPPPSVTFDLVSLTDIQGGKYDAEVLLPECFQNTLCCLFRGTSRDHETYPPVMWHCVTVSGISWIAEKVLQPSGVTLVSNKLI